MVQIRYIGQRLIAGAFDQPSDRKHREGNDGLKFQQVATVAANPHSEVNGFAPALERSVVGASGEGAG